MLADVGGPLAEDTTWTLAESPYVVVDDIDVLAGVRLTIEPGVLVRFQRNTGMTVRGELHAAADAFRRIRMEPDSAANRWEGVSFENTLADNRITYTDMIAGDEQGKRSTSRVLDCFWTT